MRIKAEVINKNNPKNDEKRLELEKELNIQRNHKNKGAVPNMTDAQINHLNYYNEIAKLNTRGIMNNPTLKEIIRITKDESCLEELKAKLQAKDLPAILETLPLLRVERINYKNIEIGQMRQKLQSNYNSGVDQEKGKQFASNVFARRLKAGGKYIPIASIDDLYGDKNGKNKEDNKIKVKKSKENKNKNNEIWTRKYKQVNTIQVKKKMENNEKNENDNDEINKYIDSNNNKIITKINFNNNINKDANNEGQLNNKYPITPQKDNNNTYNNMRNSNASTVGRRRFYHNNKANSISTLISENNQLKKELYDNKDESNVNNSKLRNRMNYRSNIDIKNQTSLQDQETPIKINVNRKLGNLNEKIFYNKSDNKKSEEHGLNKGTPGFYNKVRVRRNFYNRNNV